MIVDYRLLKYICHVIHIESSKAILKDEYIELLNDIEQLFFTVEYEYLLRF